MESSPLKTQVLKRKPRRIILSSGEENSFSRGDEYSTPSGCAAKPASSSALPTAVKETAPLQVSNKMGAKYSALDEQSDMPSPTEKQDTVFHTITGRQ